MVSCKATVLNGQYFKGQNIQLENEKPQALSKTQHSNLQLSYSVDIIRAEEHGLSPPSSKSPPHLRATILQTLQIIQFTKFSTTYLQQSRLSTKQLVAQGRSFQNKGIINPVAKKYFVGGHRAFCPNVNTMK